MAITKVTRNLLSTGIDDQSNATAITIDSSENVGIGTASPSAQLHLSRGGGTLIKLGTSQNTSEIEAREVGSANSLVFSANNSTDHLSITDGGDISFYDDTGTSQALFWDASAESLGIGTTSPFSPLHISKTDWSSGAPYGTVTTIEGNNVNDNNWGHLVITDTTTSNGNGGSIRFATGSTSSLNPIAGIQGVAEGTSYGGVGIYTRPNGGTATERMRIDSAGNVGIGNTPNALFKLDVEGAVKTKGSGFYVSENYSTGNNVYRIYENSNQFRIESQIIGSAFVDSSPIVFLTSNSSGRLARMRIDSDGNVGINTASGTAQFNVTYAYPKDGAKWTTNSNATHTAISFYTPSGNAGTINTNTLSTAYNTSSDYRLKENVVTDWDATTRLKQLKPSRFNFIADADTTVDGFLAHEVQDIVPEAISGVKDEMQEEEYEVTPAVLDEDGNVVTEAVMGTREVPKYQGIDQSKLVPLLVKTIQELEERITTLENA